MRTTFNLPPELIEKIISFTSIKDRGRLAQTSKELNEATDSNSLWNPLLKQEFRSNEQKAKEIFLNYPGRRLPQYLEVDQIGKKYKNFQGQNKDELFGSAKRNFESAKFILSTRELAERMGLKSWRLMEIVRSNVESAKFILSTPELVERMELKSWDLLSIAESNPESAKFILSSPMFAEKMADHDLLSIAKFHFESAKFILSTPELAEKMGLKSWDLIAVAKSNPESAKFILSIPEFAEKLKDSLEYIAKSLAELKSKSKKLHSLVDSSDPELSGFYEETDDEDDEMGSPEIPRYFEI